MPPTLQRILETALYVDDVARARAFYEDVMGLKAMIGDHRLCALNVSDHSVLLLFLRGASLQPSEIPGGIIPPHDGVGPLHFAFAIAAEDLDRWEQHLRGHQVAIESRTNWPAGGKSLYFRDPDGNLVELATPGVWPIY
jgi:catechol 2,3-dioxygenase-like lactoylglutathione lyase family enzyme